LYLFEEGERMRKHLGLCDRHCPKCGEKNSVHWKPNVVFHKNAKIVEFGYFFCEVCGWRSEYYETELEPIDYKQKEVKK
jgi:C4-type Zn-finger protein